MSKEGGEEKRGEGPSYSIINELCKQLYTQISTTINQNVFYCRTLWRLVHATMGVTGNIKYAYFDPNHCHGSISGSTVERCLCEHHTPTY